MKFAPLALLLSFAALAAPQGEISLVNLDGQTVSFSSVRAKVTVVSFWGTFCGPCLDELPSLEELHRRYRGDKDVAVLAVSVDPGSTPAEREKIRAIAKQLGLTMPVLIDQGPLMQALTAQGPGAPNQFTLPLLAVIDADFHVHREVGFDKSHAAGFVEAHRALIEQARAGKLVSSDGAGSAVDRAKLAGAIALGQRADALAPKSPKEALPLYRQAYAQGVLQPGLSYNAACAAARVGLVDEAFEWLNRAAEHGFSDRAWMEQDPDLASLRRDPRMKKVRARLDENHWAELAKEGAKNPKLQREILAMVEEDQLARNRLIQAKGDKQVAKQVERIDRRDTARMKQVIAKFGWPGNALVGPTAAHGAWLLVQHADLDPAFQQRCLPLLEEAVKHGDASGKDLAYLTDRLRVAHHQPQVYGTQFHTVDGKLVPRPVEDSAHLDDRRRAVGLGTMAEYEQQMQRVYAPALSQSSH